MLNLWQLASREKIWKDQKANNAHRDFLIEFIEKLLAEGNLGIADEVLQLMNGSYGKEQRIKLEELKKTQKRNRLHSENKKSLPRVKIEKNTALQALTQFETTDEKTRLEILQKLIEIVNGKEQSSHFFEVLNSTKMQWCTVLKNKEDYGRLCVLLNELPINTCSQEFFVNYVFWGCVRILKSPSILDRSLECLSCLQLLEKIHLDEVKDPLQYFQAQETLITLLLNRSDASKTLEVCCKNLSKIASDKVLETQEITESLIGNYIELRAKSHLGSANILLGALEAYFEKIFTSEPIKKSLQEMIKRP